jgi:hypothetical protein
MNTIRINNCAQKWVKLSEKCSKARLKKSSYGIDSADELINSILIDQRKVTRLIPLKFEFITKHLISIPLHLNFILGNTSVYPL